MAINITKQTSYSNTSAYSNRPLDYIVIHYTAGTTSRTGVAYNTAVMFSNPSIYASADFIVDDTTAVQFNPDIKNRYCWHCGDAKNYNKGGSYYGACQNYNSIGIEVCSSNKTGQMTAANDNNYYFTEAVINKAVELTKYLMQTYNIPANRVIRHYDVTGKYCPGIKGWNEDSGDVSAWKAFKARLSGTSSTTATTKTDTSSTKVNDNKTIYRVQIGAFSNKSNADEQLKKIKAKGFNDSFVTKVDKLYKVQVGAFTVKANAEKYRDKVKAAGFKDCFIVKSGTENKSVTEIAKEVIAGKWGVGAARKTALEKAGYDYNAVQSKVNELMK